MKKIVSKIMALVMVLTMCFAVNVGTANAASKEFAGGYGTKSSPYLVKTYDQLLNVKDYPSSYFKQIANIDCKGKKVKNLFGKTFSGNYDGNKKTISNLKVSGSNAFLTKKVSKKAVIKNLTFSKLTFNGKYKASIFETNQGTLTNVNVKNSKFTTKLKDESVYSEVAAIAINNEKTGLIKKCKITNTSFSVNVDAWTGTAQISGICSNNKGLVSGCNIKNATFKSISVEFTAKIGGITSFNDGGIVENCKVEAKKAVASGDINGYYGAPEYGEIGKIVNYNKEGIVKHCSAKGKWKGDLKAINVLSNDGGEIYR